MAKKSLTKVQKIGPCPPELNAAARDEWERIVRVLIEEDRISSLDTGVLAAYCASYARWLEAESLVTKFGQIIKSPNGHPMLSPYVILSNQQRDAMLRSAIELGITPASRLKFPKPSKHSTLESWPGDDLMPL
jgi:P27 family predicted phage terminase small subunit